jgi:glutamine synthetase
MARIRFKALEEVMKRQAVISSFPEGKVSDYFGMYVFNREKMQKYLSKEAYEHVISSIEQGTRIDRKMADSIAAGMKSWANEMGATHYTHWFQPLTEGTAEKHDAFVEPTGNAKAVEGFSGKNLVQQEPDASSFPSGGIRSTFEARGYTAWDPTSPAFILDDTLCIPTIFISYTGEALDYKTPLLKALHAVDKAAVEVCQYFDKDVSKVQANLGWEQEYFLIDEALASARPDLVLTDRTLMGHASAKDQQLEDQYFGTIPSRVLEYMKNLEFEAWKLGIPIHTRHNEVAPNQYEFAPIFEEANLAVDHNLIVMILMRRVAQKHNFRVIFHEKPFAGINGSGKHSNWSLSTNTGVVLYAPGKTPKANLQFLTYIVNTVKAVQEHTDLLRASIASAGNEHRLGANEAPPAIISVFLGSQINKMLKELEEKVHDQKMSPDEKTELKLNIGKIPEILLDNTDRNRTSPFAFTGNRFEFRAVGSNANCASAMIALNTAVADQLVKFKKEVDSLMDKGVKKDEAIFQILRKLIVDTKAIRFDGNNYSDEWKEEAARRGLSNVSSCPDALKSFVTKKSIKLFEDYKVYSEREIEARYEVSLETYTKKIQIEARVLGDLAINHIVPTAMKYQSTLIENVKGLKQIFDDKDFKELAKEKIDLIKVIGNHANAIRVKTEEMVEARKIANKLESAEEKSQAYAKKVKPFLDEIRYHIDHLELVIDDEVWPLPKYRELLFTR